MRYLAPLLVFVALAAAKPGPDTAVRLTAAPGPFTLSIEEIGSCPPRWRLLFTRNLPNPGYTMTATMKRLEDQVMRVEIHATPPTRMVAQVITPGTVRVETPFLRKGTWLVDVHYRVGEGKSKRVQAFTLEGS